MAGSVVYLSGPITGIKDFHDKFRFWESKLKEMGFTVINPAEEAEGLTKKDYMRISIARLESADFIFMLPHYEESKGAQIEKLYADYIGIEEIKLF